MSIVKAHCNECGGERNHDLLHSVQTSWEDEEAEVWSKDTYETLRCCGCELIKLRHRHMFSEDYEETITYFPPAISRPPPEWFTSLSDELDDEDQFVQKLLQEVYVAVQNDLPRLATMGVR